MNTYFILIIGMQWQNSLDWICILCMQPCS